MTVRDRLRGDPQILAMGGGGFTMEADNPALDDFVLSLVRAPSPRVLFLPTASGDTTAQITSFYARYARRASAAHLSLFRRHGSARALADIVLEQDVIYVGGGSMRNLLAIWRAHELDALLAEAWRRGIALAGLSAGAMVRAVSSRPGAAALRAALVGGELVRHRIEPELLAADQGPGGRPIPDDVRELRELRAAMRRG